MEEINLRIDLDVAFVQIRRSLRLNSVRPAQFRDFGLRISPPNPEPRTSYLIHLPPFLYLRPRVPKGNRSVIYRAFGG